MIICEHVQPPKISVPLVPSFVTLESLARLLLASVNPGEVHTKHRIVTLPKTLEEVSLSALCCLKEAEQECKPVIYV